MDTVKKAIEMINELPLEKLTAVVRFLEILKITEGDSWDEIIYKAWEATLEEEDLSPEELKEVLKGEEEIKQGLEISAEEVWKELGI